MGKRQLSKQEIRQTRGVHELKRLQATRLYGSGSDWGNYGDAWLWRKYNWSVGNGLSRKGNRRSTFRLERRQHRQING